MRAYLLVCKLVLAELPSHQHALLLQHRPHVPAHTHTRAHARALRLQTPTARCNTFGCGGACCAQTLREAARNVCRCARTASVPESEHA